MADIGSLGRVLLFAGLGLAALGGILILLKGVPGLRVGRLPGDILIERDGFTFYFPLATLLVISLIASAIILFIAWVRR
ncbi:MAG: DUF2905 domain-containing protein [Armatimonadetes bacterium]|nr:DUF2905 domain-containing protein [Armatimonadota bacterium]